MADWPCLEKGFCLWSIMEEAIVAMRVRKGLEEISKINYPGFVLFFEVDPSYKEWPIHFTTVWLRLLALFRLEYCRSISSGVRFRVQFSPECFAPSWNTFLTPTSFLWFYSHITASSWKITYNMHNSVRFPLVGLTHCAFTVVTMCFRALLINCVGLAARADWLTSTSLRGHVIGLFHVL